MTYNTKILNVTAPFSSCSSILEAAQILLSGELVAFPTETVYGLGALAYSTESIKKIFAAKGRPSDNPLIVHVAEQNQISEVGILNSRAEKLAENLMPGALTIIIKSHDKIPLIARADLPTVAVRIPQNGIALELIKRTQPLVAPSANLSTKPSPTNANHVYNDLQGRIYAILDGGDCNIGIESTVIDTLSAKPTILRAGAVTKEEIENVLGEQVIYNINNDISAPRSPGMKYKHYAPDARVSLISNETELVKFLNALLTFKNQLTTKEGNDFLNKIVITTEQHRNKFRNFFPESKIIELSQETIYSYLRKADEIQANEVIIYFEPNDNLSDGLIERIRKASN